MAIIVEVEACTGFDHADREFHPDCVTVTVDDYHVVIRDGELTVESSATAGWSPIARSISLVGDDTVVQALGGKNTSA